MFRITRIVAVVVLILSTPFLAVAGGTGEADSEPVLTPDAFYESFNMRSIDSIIRNNLSYYCLSYPNEYFIKISENNDYQNYLSDNEIQKLGKSLLVLRHSDLYWTIVFKSNNTISIFQSITNGSYRNTSEFKLYYDPEYADWRAENITAEQFIKVPPDCVSYDRP